MKKFDFAQFLQKNIENFILIILCTVYVLRGLASIEESGKTALEIFADGALAFIVGYIIKRVLDRKGILRGLSSDKFIATCNEYGNKKMEIAPIIEELAPFCDERNANELKQRQIEYLTKEALSYNKFIANEYDAKDKRIKKARRLKSTRITPTMLTNAYDNTSNEQELLSASIKKYERSQAGGDLTIGLLTAFLFGYYALKPNGLDTATVIWCALQVAIFLTNGMFKYMSSYFFITETLRGKIKRVMDIIDEFINKKRQSVKTDAVNKII